MPKYYALDDDTLALIKAALRHSAMPLPAVYKSGSSTTSTSSVIPVFQGSSATYSADEFLKRFNDLSNRAELSGEEKFAKVFEYVDSSLESVMSIIKTCAYNDWPTFERMFRTAYYTESQGIGYVQHIIKTFQDETPGFGIHIFLECFFTYTATLSKQGLMSASQRFSLLTYSLPPSYIQFLRAYSNDSPLWLSGMPSDIPSTHEKWERLISLTKQYAVDQQIFLDKPTKSELKRNMGRTGGDKGLDNRKVAQDACLSAHPQSKIKVTPSSEYERESHHHHHPKAAQCDFCGSHLPHLDEGIEAAFLKASQDDSRQSNKKRYSSNLSVGSVPSSVPSPSILSTPPEYLAQNQPISGTGSPMGSSTTEVFLGKVPIRNRPYMMAPLPPPSSPPQKDDEDTPTPEKQQRHQSSSSRTNSSAMAYTDTDAEVDSGIDTRKTSPLSPKGSTFNFSSSDLITQYNNSSRNLTQYNNDSPSTIGERRDREFTSPAGPPPGGRAPGMAPAREDTFGSTSTASSKDTRKSDHSSISGITTSTAASKKEGGNNNSGSAKEKAYTIDEKERRVWELFLRANNKVRPAPISTTGGGKDKTAAIINHNDDGFDGYEEDLMPDEDIFNIDEIIASQMDFGDGDDDDSSSISSSASSADSFHPEIPVDTIMSQFAEPGLTADKEHALVMRYADVLTCYKMSEFVAYPEDLLKHVFEVVLSYTYSTLED